MQEIETTLRERLTIAVMVPVLAAMIAVGFLTMWVPAIPYWIATGRNLYEDAWVFLDNFMNWIMLNIAGWKPVRAGSSKIPQ